MAAPRRILHRPTGAARTSRLRRARQWQAPTGHRGVVLAAAVAIVPVIIASSAAISSRPAGAHPQARTSPTAAAPAAAAGPASLATAPPPAPHASATATPPRHPTSPGGASNAPDATTPSALAADGIPATALRAYQQAAMRENAVDPACGLGWPLLAAIGRVESDHGRFAGAVLHTDGLSTPHVIGPPLDGHGTVRILDTDHGLLDGDPVFDRAVGPMQFIPSTWALYGVDGNHDGRADPFNIFDAAATAARYLCAAGGNLTTVAGQTQAVLTYNDSAAYLSLVLALESTYARGVPGVVVPVPPLSSAPQRHGSPKLPPAAPGTALGMTHRAVTPVPGHPSSPATNPAATNPPATTGSATPAPSASSTPTPHTPAPSTAAAGGSPSPPSSSTGTPRPASTGPNTGGPRPTAPAASSSP